jgi:large subunit ribosomal protein L32
MAVPKKKQSKTRTAKRRATWKASPSAYSGCPQCKQPTRPHRVCANCGYYAGRQAIEVE